MIPSKKGEKTGPIGGGYGLVPVKTIISSAESYYTRVLCRKLWRVFITERMETCRLGSRHSVESRYSPVTKFLRRANDPCVPIPLPPPTHTRLWKHVRSRSTLNYVHYRVPGDVVPSGGPVCRRYGGAEMLEKQGERRVMTGGGSGVGGGDDIGSFCYGTSLTILFIE